MGDPAEKETDWAKWSALAAIAAVVATLLAVYVAHSDQKERVYVTLSPVQWEIDGRDGTVTYKVTVTGKTPARNVYLAERCVSPIPRGKEVELTSDDRRLWALALLPGTIEKHCSIFGLNRNSNSSVKYVADVSYEDDAGQHSTSFCFYWDGPMSFQLGSNRESSGLNPCGPN